ncbi:hypothetical protein Leryth_024766 [Lithospermum erythrorhizon]|nr:hypothetical protein Leryth_024766 [Lithospermum erythrorhizon]
MDLMRPDFNLNDSKYLSPFTSPASSYIDKPIHPSHTSFPILVVAIIGILATALLLVSYYVFVIKCCLNWHRIDLLGRFTYPRTRRVDDPLIYSQATENRGLDEAVIRSIPVFKFKKSEAKDGLGNTFFECSVCLNEFQENEKLRSIPNCAHIFHIDCIDVWLQNNANCPLCRNSITISATERYTMDQIMVPPTTFLHDSGDNFPGRDEDFVVIELGQHDHNVGIGTHQELHRAQERLYSGDFSAELQISPSPRKLHQPKILHKKVKKCNIVSSMGDECIDMRQKNDEFSVQPIRRSISMDSAADRQLYIAIQETLQHRQLSDISLHEGSSNRLKKLFFSFGHGRGSNRAILPVDVDL